MSQSVPPSDPSREPSSGPALQDRYGRPRPGGRRGVVVASGVVGLVALAWVAWAAWAQATPQVQSRMVTYDVVGVHRADARVTVELTDPSVRASCLVRAVADDRSVVGEQSFPVTGVEGRKGYRLQVRTERRATSVEMVGCTTPDQSRPR